MPDFTIETAEFRRALATALPFVSDDEDLELLHVVRIEPSEDGAVEVAATDRFTLSIETLPVAGEPFAASIPADIAERLLALVLPDPVPGTLTTITRSEDGRVTVTVAGDVCDTTISFTAPRRFVSYRHLLNKRLEAEEEPATQVAFTPAPLAKAATAFADRNTGGDPLTMRFNGQHGGVLIEGTGGHALKILAMPARLADAAAAWTPPVPVPV